MNDLTQKIQRLSALEKALDNQLDAMMDECEARRREQHRELLAIEARHKPRLEAVIARIRAARAEIESEMQADRAEA